MDIKGKITGIKYKVSTSETLKVVDIQDFNINESPAFCLVKDKNNSFAVSKWVSPKRTRSYPYERVYNTLNSSKKITITNYLGGQYLFTVDEILIKNNTVYLIESKHSANSILPSKGDIKDDLLKMILYSNLSEVEVDSVKMKSKAVLKLTSEKIRGEISSEIPVCDRSTFLLDNDFSQEQIWFIDVLLKEGVENGFEVRIGEV